MVTGRIASLADKAGEATGRMRCSVRMAALSGMTTVMLAVPTVVSYAADDVSGGTNVLDGLVMDAITKGFSNLVVTFTALVAIGCVAGVTIAGTAAGAKYAVKYIKGLLSQAG